MYPSTSEESLALRKRAGQQNNLVSGYARGALWGVLIVDPSTQHKAAMIAKSTYQLNQEVF